jgi:hypothetical protein
MTSRQSSANELSVARRPIAADGRFMSNGSCPSNARTSVNPRTRAVDAASQPGAGIAMTQANALRGAPAGQQQAPSREKIARRRARFKKPGRNADKTIPHREKSLLPALPMSMEVGPNVCCGHTGNSSKKMGGAATKRENDPMVLSRQGSMKGLGAADRQATQDQQAGVGPEGVAAPQNRVLAANRDAPCALSAAY